MSGKQTSVSPKIKKRLSVLTACVAGLLSTGTAQAAIFISFDIAPTLNAGVDSLGLAGASVTLNATIADGTTYVAGSGDAAGVPNAPFSTASLTITGASVPGNNGTFALANSVSLGAFPSFSGGAEFFTASDGSTFSTADLSGSFSISDFRIAASQVSGLMLSAGELVLAEHFDGVTIGGPGQVFTGNDLPAPVAIYNIPGGGPISAVPESSALALITGFVLMVFAIINRQHHSQKHSAITLDNE